MSLAAMAVVVIAILAAGFWMRRQRIRRELDAHAITADELQALRDSGQEVLLYDVRQPLDLLAHAEIIPGATRIAPKDLLAHPDVIPREKEVVVYCTCPSEKTSREITRRAAELSLLRVKFLRGGLSAWKEKGLPVEPYTNTFRLDTAM